MQDSTPDTNFGTATDYCGQIGGNRWHAFLTFDLSSIPSGSTISSATLKLTPVEGQTNSVINFYSLLKYATEDGETWNKYDGTNAWATAGGGSGTDYDADLIGTVTLDGSGSYTFAIATSTISAWVNGTKTNDGIFCKAADEGSTNYIAAGSREHATPSSRPLLTVEYTVSSSTPPTTPTSTTQIVVVESASGLITVFLLSFMCFVLVWKR